MNEHSKFRTHKQMNDRTNTIDTRTKQIYLYFNAHHTTPQFTILFCSFSMFDLYVRCSVYYYQYRSLPWTCEKSRKEADREREREKMLWNATFNIAIAMYTYFILFPLRFIKKRKNPIINKSIDFSGIQNHTILNNWIHLQWLRFIVKCSYIVYWRKRVTNKNEEWVIIVAKHKKAKTHEPTIVIVWVFLTGDSGETTAPRKWFPTYICGFFASLRSRTKLPEPYCLRTRLARSIYTSIYCIYIPITTTYVVYVHWRRHPASTHEWNGRCKVDRKGMCSVGCW